jgi:signal transduction histidine kinase
MRMLTALARRVRALDPLVADGLLAGLLAAASLIQIFAGLRLPGTRDPDVLAVAFTALATLPVTWRRRAPLRVLALTFAATLVANVLGVPIGNGLGVLVALYTVAAVCARRRSVLALVLVTGLTMLLLVAGVLFAPVEITVDYFLNNLLVIAAAWILGDNLRTRRAYTAELEARAARLEAEREAHAQAAAARERARIARELHDVVAHHVSVMAVQAGAARRVAATRPERAREALESIEGAARQALVELRRLLGVLRGGGEAPAGARSPQPGLGELAALVEQTRAAGLAVELVVEGDDRRSVQAAVGLSAYRIVQEALTNTLKHAGASRATVLVRYGAADLDVRVEDDGRGIVDHDELERGGHGLLGMRERAALFGGELRAGPRLGGGFRVQARLPRDPDDYRAVRTEPAGSDARRHA